MKKGTAELLKFKKLSRRLKLSKWATVGVLESLWHVAMNDTPAGDIGRLSNDDIALAIDWDDDENELVAALIETGWLDEHPEHRLVVHDWHDHAPNWLKGNLAKHGRSFVTEPPNDPAKHPAEDVAKHGAKQLADPGSQAATRPSLTQPDPAQPDPASTSPDPTQP